MGRVRSGSPQETERSGPVRRYPRKVMPAFWSETGLPLAAATAFFVGLHVVTLGRVEPVYPRAFKLSRAGAAVVLTALGAAALVDGFPHWREAYLYHHDDGDWMRYGLLAVCGHLVADYIWMIVGKVRHGIEPRKDLIIHHGLGVVGFGIALWMRVGYAIALVTMVTEILPLTTGINAWGKRVASEGVMRIADRARLHVLAWLRLPLWLALVGLSVWALVRGDAGDLAPAYVVAAVGLSGLVALDVYWMQKCRANVDFY